MRRFSTSQRVALYVASDGYCSICGADLGPTWHADHVQPYSKGGETQIDNGQALCPTCNLRKGNKMEPALLWPDCKPLRKWQELAVRRFNNHPDREDFMVVATPGAGKTTFGLRIAHGLLTSHAVERVVVVCPTEHLKDQWADAANEVGIYLNPKISNDKPREATDYHGVVLTYQQIGLAPDTHRIQCRRPTLVILDEIHHAGDQKSWGEGIGYAFEFATQRLLMSGTPFRTDNNRIPFMRYDLTGKSKSDYAYSYGEALGDRNVVRPVLFPKYEGNFEWFSNGTTYSATFGDDLAGPQASERLNTALSPNAGWLKQVIKEANEKLIEIRASGHPEAAGLIITKEHDHARQVADLVKKITGTSPVVALSDDPEANTKIERFKKSKSPWIVAVRMVSEGVDIPRLRVCVYATNYLTELFFRQALGRVLRWTDGLEEQSAYFYIPKVQELITWAQRVKEERDHQLQEEIARQKQEREVGTRADKLFAPITGEAIADGMIHDGEDVSQNELLEAEQYREKAGMPSYVPAATVAKLMGLIRATLPAVVTTINPMPSRSQTPRLDQLKDSRRKTIRRLVAQLVEATGQTENPLDYREVHLRLRYLDDTDQEHATLDQLDKRLVVLAGWLRGFVDGA